MDIVSIDTPVIDSRKDLFGSLSVNEELLSHTISSNRYGGLSMIQQPHINAKDENNTYQVDSENFGDFIEVIDSFRFLVNTESMTNKQGRKEANKNLSDLGNTMIASSDFMDLLSDAEMVDNGDHFTYTIDVEQEEFEKLSKTMILPESDVNLDFRGIYGKKSRSKIKDISEARRVEIELNLSKEYIAPSELEIAKEIENLPHPPICFDFHFPSVFIQYLRTMQQVFVILFVGFSSTSLSRAVWSVMRELSAAALHTLSRSKFAYLCDVRIRFYALIGMTSVIYSILLFNALIS